MSHACDNQPTTQEFMRNSRFALLCVKPQATVRFGLLLAVSRELRCDVPRPRSNNMVTMFFLESLS